MANQTQVSSRGKPRFVVLEHQMTVQGHDLYERREVAVHLDAQEQVTRLRCDFIRSIDSKIFNVKETRTGLINVNDRIVITNLESKQEHEQFMTDWMALWRPELPRNYTGLMKVVIELEPFPFNVDDMVDTGEISGLAPAQSDAGSMTNSDGSYMSGGGQPGYQSAQQTPQSGTSGYQSVQQTPQPGNSVCQPVTRSNQPAHVQAQAGAYQNGAYQNGAYAQSSISGSETHSDGGYVSGGGQPVYQSAQQTPQSGTSGYQPVQQTPQSVTSSYQPVHQTPQPVTSGYQPAHAQAHASASQSGAYAQSSIFRCMIPSQQPSQASQPTPQLTPSEFRECSVNEAMYDEPVLQPRTFQLDVQQNVHQKETNDGCRPPDTNIRLEVKKELECVIPSMANEEVDVVDFDSLKRCLLQDITEDIRNAVIEELRQQNLVAQKQNASAYELLSASETEKDSSASEGKGGGSTGGTTLGSSTGKKKKHGKSGKKGFSGSNKNSGKGSGGKSGGSGGKGGGSGGKGGGSGGKGGGSGGKGGFSTGGKGGSGGTTSGKRGGGASGGKGGNGGSTIGKRSGKGGSGGASAGKIGGGATGGKGGGSGGVTSGKKGSGTSGKKSGGKSTAGSKFGGKSAFGKGTSAGGIKHVGKNTSSGKGGSATTARTATSKHGTEDGKKKTQSGASKTGSSEYELKTESSSVADSSDEVSGYELFKKENNESNLPKTIAEAKNLEKDQRKSSAETTSTEPMPSASTDEKDTDASGNESGGKNEDGKGGGSTDGKDSYASGKESGGKDQDGQGGGTIMEDDDAFALLVQEKFIEETEQKKKSKE